MYTMKQLIQDIHALAEALCMEKKEKPTFTHESGFNSIQGKYSLVCDTRGLVLASEECCDLLYVRKVEEDKKAVEEAINPLEHTIPLVNVNIEVKEMRENALRFNEYGELVYPPERPQPPKPLKTDNWKNITPRRREKILQYELDKEGYEIALAMYHYKMEKYLKLPTLSGNKMETIIESMREQGRIIRDKGGLVVWSSLPQEVDVVFHKAHLLTWEETLAHNPDKAKVNPQTTLDGIVRNAPQLRVVDFDIITSFGAKPNFLLEKSWLLHLLNGENLSETERQFLKERKELGRKMRGY